jgi:voltage-gated potassium channel
MAVNQSELKNANYESFMVALTILSLANLGFVILFPREPANEIVRTVDVGLSIVFLLDFGYRLFSAQSKRRYFLNQLGWLDLIGSLPVPFLRLARLYRVIVVTRALGPLRGRLWRRIVEERAGTTLFAVLFLVVVLLEVASGVVLAIEMGAPESNIHNASDALWYTWVSITTVGYGDRYPVTNAGRIIGAITLAVGVALVGALTGFLANAFLGPDLRYQREVTNAAQRLRDELAEMREEIRRLRAEQETDPNGQAAGQAGAPPREGRGAPSETA